MKLATWGRTVIIVPWLFQIVLLAFLFVFVFKEQKLVEHSARSQLIVSRCNALVTQLADCMLVFMEATDPHAAPGAGSSDFQIELFEHHANTIFEVMNQPTEEVLVSRMHQAIGRILTLMKGWQSLILADKNHIAAESIQLNSMPMLKQLLDSLDDVFISEASQKSDERINDLSNRNRIKLSLALAGLFGLAMSFLVAGFCVLRIRQRINLIDENMKSFALRQTLAPSMSGQDELSTLDRIIHQVDAAISEATERERRLIDNAADFICSINRDGNFERVNAFSQRLLGLPPDALVGAAVIDVVATDDCLQAHTELTAATATEGFRTFELRLVHRDKHYVDTSWSTFWSEPDASLFCVVTDITEHKRIERLKTDFIAMISHDLRTPLMSLLLDISLLLRNASLPQAELDSLEDSEDAVNYLINLVNDLLDYEKLLAGQMKLAFDPVKVDTLLADCYCAFVGNESKPEITTTCDSTIYGDRDRLVQMLTYLVHHIHRNSSSARTVQLSANLVNTAVVIELNDPGSQILSVSFEPFADDNESDRSTGAGTGLELAISKLIADAHGASLEVVAAPQGGRLFKCTFCTFASSDGIAKTSDQTI